MFHCVISMLERIQAFIDANGWYTRYKTFMRMPAFLLDLEPPMKRLTNLLQ